MNKTGKTSFQIVKHRWYIELILCWVSLSKSVNSRTGNSVPKMLTSSIYNKFFVTTFVRIPSVLYYDSTSNHVVPKRNVYVYSLCQNF